MNESKFKPGEWEKYRFLAKCDGLTIPAFKKILAEEGLLAANKLTKIAEERQIGVAEMISSRFGTDKCILWSVPMIAELLNWRNINPLAGDEQFLFVENFYQITRKIECLGKQMLACLKISEAPENGGLIYPEWIKDRFGADSENPLVDAAVTGLMNAVFENHRYLRSTRQSEFMVMLEKDFQAAFELAKHYWANEYEKLRLAFFIRLERFIGEWAIDKRIGQYNRQPYRLAFTEIQCRAILHAV